MVLRKLLVLFFSVIILSGCATYKFQKSGSGQKQGYLVVRQDASIPEYTIGKEKALPADLALAKQRFSRRRPTVENYYKKMGRIESRFQENFLDPVGMAFEFIGGVLCWPITAISDYRYNHNPKYRDRVDKIDEQKDTLEKARIDALKEKLDAYIVKDLAKESGSVESVPAPVVPAPVASVEPAQETPAPVTTPVAQETPTPITPAPVVQEPPVKPVVFEPAPVKIQEPPVAVIIAKPQKGYSPLKVNFSSQKSYSKSGKIVSYLWDFGDGDTSTKKNPENTYWSTFYGLRQFIATLTVKDDKGLSSSSSVTIEVSTR